MTDPISLTEAFEDHRPYLRRVAVGMLGSDNEAEDAVQEAWLRLNRTGGDGIEDLRAWLTTVISRICLDVLRARRTRHEVPVEIDLDELVAGSERPKAGAAPTPEEEILLAASVGMALHVVMEGLTPAERVAFVLHDVFGVPFAEIAEVLGRSTAAVKMLASRARQRVRLVPPETYQDDAEGRAVVDAFFTAAGSGDLSGLLALLAPEVELRATTPSGAVFVKGAERVAEQAKLGASRSGSETTLLPITDRDAPGALIVVDGRPVTVMTFGVRRGRIDTIRSVTNPKGLAQVVPSWAI